MSVGARVEGRERERERERERARRRKGERERESKMFRRFINSYKKTGHDKLMLPNTIKYPKLK